MSRLRVCRADAHVTYVRVQCCNCLFCSTRNAPYVHERVCITATCDVHQVVEKVIGHTDMDITVIQLFVKM